MSSTSDNRSLSSASASHNSKSMASKQPNIVSINQLPTPPPKARSSAPPTKATGKNSDWRPSLVQFSCPQKRGSSGLNLFSTMRAITIIATTAGLPLAIIQARSAETASLLCNVLGISFVRNSSSWPVLYIDHLSSKLAFSFALSIFDLAQFHYSRLPHRVEAMLDLLLAFAFLAFFLVDVIKCNWATATVLFLVS